MPYESRARRSPQWGPAPATLAQWRGSRERPATDQRRAKRAMRTYKAGLAIGLALAALLAQGPARAHGGALHSEGGHTDRPAPISKSCGRMPRAPLLTASTRTALWGISDLLDIWGQAAAASGGKSCLVPTSASFGLPCCCQLIGCRTAEPSPPTAFRWGRLSRRLIPFSGWTRDTSVL